MHSPWAASIHPAGWCGHGYSNQKRGREQENIQWGQQYAFVFACEGPSAAINMSAAGSARTMRLSSQFASRRHASRFLMVTLITLLILVTALEAEKGDNSILGTARSSKQTAFLRCVDQEERGVKSQLWRRLFPHPATLDTCEWGRVKLHPMLDCQSSAR